MLLTLTFQNHRTFRDTTTISFVPDAPPDAASHRLPSHHAEHGVLPVLGLWGTTATGKTGALSALELMRWFVRATPAWAAKWVPRWQPWRFDESESAPAASYAVELELAETRYRYAFTVHAGGVLAESLHVGSGHATRLVFRRDGLGAEATWELDPETFAPGTRDRMRATPANLLSLAVGAPEHPALGVVYGAFDGMRVHTAALHGARIPLDSPLARPEQVERLAAFVRSADIGAETMTFERLDPPRFDPDPSMSAEDARGFLLYQEFLNKGADSFYRPRVHPRGGWSLPRLGESRGTRILLDRLCRILPALEDGQLVALDELDLALSPRLVRSLIQLFTTPETNPRGAQLLFTALHPGLDEALSADAIAVVRRGPDGASSLARASDSPYGRPLERE